jgi:hypothetical protein
MIRLSALFLCVSACLAFAPTPRLGLSSRGKSLKAFEVFSDILSNLPFSGPPPEALTNEMEYSRQEFYFWFFGASGAASIGRKAIPRFIQQVSYIQGLKGTPTASGEMLGISPLCGYPQDLAIKDLEKIVKNPLSIERIVEQFPIKGNFLSEKGYVTFDAFTLANKDASPLAIRAVFDTFAQSNDLCDPEIAQKKMDSYKQDITLIKGGVNYSKATGAAAILTLLLLLGGADIVASYHFYMGWFPYWPGGVHFPLSMLDTNGAPWDLPNYWI